MTSVLSTAASFRILFVGLLLVLFTAGCCKHEDDCPAPGDDGSEATTRMYTGAGSEHDMQEERPVGASHRGVEVGEGDTDGDGISDDGDDEADGEGNKKRAQH